MIILFIRRLLRVLKWGVVFNERRGMTVTDHSSTQFLKMIYKNTADASEGTVLLQSGNAVGCGFHTEHIHTLCGQSFAPMSSYVSCN
jgi:hypothetical protein